MAVVDRITPEQANAALAIMAALAEPRNAKPRGAALPVKPRTGNVGRNDPCPCGSGQKSKRCCRSGRIRTP